MKEIINKSLYTIVFVAPFYNRSGYGVGARSLAISWHKFGLNIKLLAVDNVEEGIDDCDINLLKQLESTPIIGTVVLIIYHVPHQNWLNIKLPTNSLRIIFTTYDGTKQGLLPPSNWIRICNQMDMVFIDQSENAQWIEAGLNPKLLKSLYVPPLWVDNDFLPKVSFKPRNGVFRFLTIAMFLPRRRWKYLIAAFLEEFANKSDVELYIKVNYPEWHPINGKPKNDLLSLVNELRSKISSKANVIIDDNIGTRVEICKLIDDCDFFISTDTALTAPVGEALIRGKHVIVAHTLPADLSIAKEAWLTIDTQSSISEIITDDILEYQPHHKGTELAGLDIKLIRQTLNLAFQYSEEVTRHPWQIWDQWLDKFNSNANVGILSNLIESKINSDYLKDQINLSWEGSQFVYHSLAHVNRQICKNLMKDEKINLSIIPYEDNDLEFNFNSDFRQLISYTNKPMAKVDVHIRHQWPPNFIPPQQGAWVIIQPWEFGGIPKDWVRPMQEQVDEIWVPTSFVKKCYILSGVSDDKIHIIPNGVDSNVFSPEGQLFEFTTKKKFKILFVGGTIHRKGIDVLLKSYSNTFLKSDDICLIIKGQAGGIYPKSELNDYIYQLSKDNPNFPEIEYINKNLNELELASLYRSVNCFCLPYRGEGFGLPIIEAMSCGIPVIITGNGASKDFTNESFAYLIESTRTENLSVDSFEPSAPGFWLEEPSEINLSEILLQVYNNPDEAFEKGLKGRKYAIENLNWSIVYELVTERLKYLKEIKPLRNKEKKTFFILESDYTSNSLMEVLLSYFSAFKPTCNVALAILFYDHDSHFSTKEMLLDEILKTMKSSGLSEFPEILIVHSLQEYYKIVNIENNFQFIRNKKGSTVGLSGPLGFKLAKSRLIISDSYDF